MSDAKENPWAESPKHQNDAVSAPKQQHEDNKEQHSKPKETSNIFNKTKEGAFRGWKKAREGASVGIFWMKDRFRKPAAAAGKTPPATTPPPPPSSP